jgi:hypothetical protein
MSMYSRRKDYYDRKRRERTPGYQDIKPHYPGIGEDNFSGFKLANVIDTTVADHSPRIGEDNFSGYLNNWCNKGK